MPTPNFRDVNTEDLAPKHITQLLQQPILAIERAIRIA